jgi:hypothetical protein
MEIHHGKHWAAGTYYVYLEGAGWKSSPVALSVQK